MASFEKIAKSAFLNGLIQKKPIYLILKFFLDLEACSIVLFELMPFFWAVFCGLFLLSVYLGFKWFFFGLLMFMLLSYISFNSSELKKKASSGVLFYLFFGRNLSGLFSIILLNFLLVAGLVWVLV